MGHSVRYMITSLSVALAVVVATCALVMLDPQAEAQDGKDNENESAVSEATSIAFNEARVSDILTWARRTSGTGFLFERSDLLDAEGKELQVSYTPPVNQNYSSLQLIRQALRKVGLVLLEVGELDQVYQVSPLDEARGLAPLVERANALEDASFATLAIEARTLTTGELEPFIRERLSSHGHVAAFEATGRVLVTDFAANLRSIDAQVFAAQEKARRADDTVYELFKPERHTPLSLANALDAGRAVSEQFNVSIHEESDSVVVTGRRSDVERALDRMRALDVQPLNPDYTSKMHTLEVGGRSLDEAFVALSDYFGAEVSQGRVRMSKLPRTSQMLFHGTEKHAKLARGFLIVYDRVPNKSKVTEDRDGDGIPD